MLIIKFSIDCNDTGAFLFDSGCYNDAMQLFQIAMTIMQLIEQGFISQKSSLESILSTSCSTTPIDKEQQNKFKWALQRTLLKAKGDAALLNACSSTAQQDTDQKHSDNTYNSNDSSCLETSCALYCKPIRLVDTMILKDSDFDISCDKVYGGKENQGLRLIWTSAIIFNTGLSYHIMRDDLASSSSSDALQAASSIYGHVYSTLLDHQNTIMMTADSHLFYAYYRLVIGVLNNVAQINEELDNFDSMQRCLGILSSFDEELSLSLPPVSSNNSSGYQDFLDDVGGFLWFARVFKGPATPAT